MNSARRRWTWSATMPANVPKEKDAGAPAEGDDAKQYGAREPVGEPAHRDLLQPRPHHRQSLPDEEQPDVPVAQRAERAGSAGISAECRTKASRPGLPRRDSARIDPRAARAVLQPLARRFEARGPLALLFDGGGGARATKLSLRACPQLCRSPPRRARSPSRDARARQRHSPRCAASASFPRRSRIGASVTGRSSTLFIAETFASDGRYGAKCWSRSGSPATSSGTRCAGDNPISLAARDRRRRGPSAAPCRAPRPDRR